MSKTPTSAGNFQAIRNGRRMRATGDFKAKVSFNKITREVRPDGTVDKKEEKQEGKISGEILITKGEISVADIVDTTPCELTIVAIDGKKYSGTDMTYSGDGEVSIGEGKLSVEWMGEVTEIF